MNVRNALVADVSARVRVGFVSLEGKVYYTHGTFVTPKVFCTVGHVVPYGCGGSSPFIGVTLQGRTTGLSRTKQYSLVDHRHYPERDLAVWRLGNDAPPNRALPATRFMPQSVLDTLPRCHVMLTAVEYGTMPVLSLEDAMVDVIEDTSYESDHGDITVRKAVGFTTLKPTSLGTCGECYVMEMNGTVRYIAMHTAGDGVSVSTGTPLSREWFDEVTTWGATTVPQPPELTEGGSLGVSLAGVELKTAGAPIHCMAQLDPRCAAVLPFKHKIELTPWGAGEVFGEHKYLPAVLSEDGLQKALAKLHPREVTPTRLPNYEWVLARMCAACPPMPDFQPWTVDDAIRACAKDTSMGFPWVKEMHGGSAKGNFLGVREDGTVWCDERIRCAVEQRIERACRGERTLTFFSDTLKAELRPTEKIVKPRLFSCGPVDHALALSRYMKPIQGWIMEHCRPISVGINPHGKDWKDLCEHLLQDFGGDCEAECVFATDVERADASMSAAQWELVRAFFAHIVGGVSVELETYLWEIQQAYHVCRDKVYVTHNAVPSGCVATSIIMSSLVWSLLLSAVKHVCDETGVDAERLKEAFYGDDNLCVCPGVNWDLVVDFIKRVFGIVLTSDTKEAVIRLQSMSQVHYLSRMFKDGGRQAPLDIDKVLRICYWTRDRCQSSVQSSLDNMALELTHHGREQFQAVRSAITSTQYFQLGKFTMWTWETALSKRSSGNPAYGLVADAGADCDDE